MTLDNDVLTTRFPLLKSELKWDQNNGTGVLAKRLIFDGYQINFIANGLHPRSTGPHATISICEQSPNFKITEQDPHGKTIVYTTFNIGKNEDRTRLANAAYKLLVPKDEKLYSPYKTVGYDNDFLKVDLDRFCIQIEQVWESQFESELTTGDPTLIQKHRIYPFAVSDGGTIMFARPKSGKSFLALAMAVSIDSGVNKFWKIEQCPVLYVNLERSARSMQQRLGNVNRALGLKPNRPLRFLHARGRSLKDIVNPIKRAMSKHNIKYVILDSISRSGMGDLTSNDVANRITDSLNSIIEKGDNERGYLAIAHTSWSEEHVYGSIHFEAAADSICSVKTSKNEYNELGVQLQVDRGNDVSGGVELPMLKFCFSEFGLSEISSASADDFPDLIPDTLSERISKYLVRNPDKTPVEISQSLKINDSSVRGILHRNKDMFKKNGSTYRMAEE
tara:strand:+ start:1922 stop:3265 length:1344 start_codon:yes stop_codon:yes gene_type:complete